MFIDGFGISSYRSFGAKQYTIGPLNKINILIGQNNSGKSNVIRFVNEHLNKIVSALCSRNSYKFDTLNTHYGDNSSQIIFSIIFKKHALLQEWFNSEHCYNIMQTIIDDILSYSDDNNYFELQFNMSPGFSLDNIEEIIISSSKYNPSKWLTLSREFAQRRSSNEREIIRNVVLKLIDNLIKDKRNIKTEIIPAIRKIGVPESKFNGYGGEGVIEALAMLQNPTLDRQADRKKFNAINKFLYDVTGNDSIKLNIPHDAKDILVDSDGKMLPLSSLGTGIHEVVILAAAATYISNSIVCIEEPELHLHPSLQKRLIKYLSDNTDNQYIITTHSAHIIDTVDASVFHIKNDRQASTANFIRSNNDKFQICCDIGFKASDIVQSNCIIWVEGPSDRIYLNHWLKTAPDNFIEGLHYSIMFYGGRLLSHLSGDDNTLEEFISLRMLNRNSCILIDSDYKNAKNKKLNDTKKRLCNEFNAGPGFAWITAGREIENYISAEIISSSLMKMYKGMRSLKSTGQFDKIYSYINSTGKTVEEVDKIRLAHLVVNNPPQLDILDLKNRIKQLGEFISAANKV